LSGCASFVIRTAASSSERIKTKATKAAAESQRIATKKVDWALAKLAESGPRKRA
jgi:hypothetical protein